MFCSETPHKPDAGFVFGLLMVEMVSYIYIIYYNILLGFEIFFLAFLLFLLMFNK